MSATPVTSRTAINRRNSRHSTGPRTDSGKQRSSLNALRHGLTAASAVLPSEDQAAYDAHRRGFFDEYNPPPPPRPSSSRNSPTPPGVSTASHRSKPSCFPKTPPPKP
jgi:hypothetical protein